MKKLVLILFAILLFTGTAFAQYGYGQSRRSLAQHERWEMTRLRDHQRWEMRQCRLTGRDCRYVRRHQNRERKQLQRHWRMERRGYRFRR